MLPTRSYFLAVTSLMFAGAGTSFAGDPMDTLEDHSPIAYVVGSVAMIVAGGLITTLKILWDDNKQLRLDKDALHDSKLQIAISTTETMKEALGMVKDIHDQVSKLADDDVNRMVTEETIREKLTTIQNEVRLLGDEVRKSIAGR